MKLRIILIAVAVTIAILAAANFTVGRAASNSVPRQTMRHIDAAGQVIDVLGMGNSLMAAGFDEAAVRRTLQQSGRDIVAINGGLGSSGAIEHLDLTRRALQHHTVRELVYGFFDQQMSTETPLKNSDLIGNRAMLYYDEPQLALRYGQFDWLERIEFQTYRCCALLRERSNIWAKVEKMRRGMEEVGMPRQETNQFGRRADFNLLESNSAEQFARQCRYVIAGNDFLSPAVREIFKEAQASGTRVTVVEMPMHPLHVKRFYDQPVWSEYSAGTRTALARAGVAFIDASRWIPRVDDFQDHLHLAASGAERFSQLLAERLLRHDSQ